MPELTKAGVGQGDTQIPAQHGAVDVGDPLFRVHHLDRVALVGRELRGVALQTFLAEAFDSFSPGASHGVLEANVDCQLVEHEHSKWHAKLLVSSRDELLTFGGEVEFVVLEDISTNLDSKRKPVTRSARQKGKYPYYGASGIVDYVSYYIFDGNYLLISEDGANLLARKTPIAFSSQPPPSNKKSQATF